MGEFQATRSEDRSGCCGGVSGGRPCAARAASQRGLCRPSTHEASNSRQALERCSYRVQRTAQPTSPSRATQRRSEEHTSELQSRENLVCRLLLEKKKE